jgi:hypothetical protein
MPAPVLAVVGVTPGVLGGAPLLVVGSDGSLVGWLDSLEVPVLELAVPVPAVAPAAPVPAVGSEGPPVVCVPDCESDEGGVFADGVVTAGTSDGSVSGGICGCTLQIQAMIWIPGFRTEFLSSVGDPSRENGPNEAAFARAATSLSDQAASITRFFTAMNAVGMKANGPVFAGAPEA